jgi:O-antigen biosynthesis protein
MHKTVKRWLTLPYRMVGLVTSNRLERLWYYIRSNQTAIIWDRVKRLLALGTAAPMALRLYAPTDRPGPLVFEACESPLVSIVIPVYNQWETTRACLLSILENTDSIAFEVIVADDGSTDLTQQLHTLAPGVLHVVNPVNLGFLRNCNHAAQQARGSYVLLLNNDTQVQPHWLDALLEVAEADAQTGIVGPMLLYPDGSLQEAGGIIWKDGSGWNYGKHDYPERPEYNYRKEVDYISGACILVRKSLWQALGGFDERFSPAYYEDTDLAFAAREFGYKVVYQPRSRVVHLEGISHGTDVNQGVKARQVVNQQIFRAKWHTQLDQDHGDGPGDLSWARDRSRLKKQLLFIDHYVPLRDQDAGSRSTFQYLLLMAEMGYQITFLGDNFVDYQPYTAELQQRGIEILYGPGLQRNWKRWLAQHGQRFDYVYLSRPHITRKYLPAIRRHTAAKLLYCGHDLHCLREERHFQLEGKPVYRKAALRWAQWEESILRQVDMAYFFSRPEVAEVHRRFPGVKVRDVPIYFFDALPYTGAADFPFSARKGLLFVGGFMHVPNVEGVRWFVQAVLPLVRESLPDVDFTIVGSNPTPEVVNLAGAHTQVTGRVTDAALLQHYREARLVVAPLRFGAGIKGKIVEAMQHGVPVVTTSVGAEGIAEGESGLFVADEAHGFATALVQAYTSEADWSQAQRAGLQAIARHFSKDAARSILLQDMPL